VAAFFPHPAAARPPSPGGGGSESPSPFGRGVGVREDRWHPEPTLYDFFFALRLVSNIVPRQFFAPHRQRYCCFSAVVNRSSVVSA